MYETDYKYTFGDEERRFWRSTYNAEKHETTYVDADTNWFELGKEYESGGAGVITTVDDYIKFAQMLCDGGVTPEGKRIIAFEGIDLMRKTINESQSAFTMTDYKYALGVRTHISNENNFSKSGLYEFGWDGAYSYSVTEEEVERLLSKAEALTKDALEQYYARIIADTGVDTDVEEYLASVGTDLDAVAGEMKVGEEIEAIVERLNGEGYFTAEKKSIFAKEIIGSFNSFSGFEDYEFKDDTLKVNSRFLQKEIFYKKQ